MWLSAVLAENSVAAFLQHGKIEHLFKGTEVEVYEFVRDFVKQYQALPTEETIEKHTGEKLVPHTEPSGYYFDLMEARHIELSLKRTMKEVSNLLLPENKDPHEALGLIADAAMQLIAQKHSKQIVDFRDAYGLLMKTYASKFNAMDEYGLQLGWPTLDKMSGGLVRGDVLSIVGRPAAGKSLMLLYGALHGWKKAGEEAVQGKTPEHDQSRMFVSMEMDVLSIQQRLAALQTSLPAAQLKHATLSTANLSKLKKGLTEIKGYPFPFYVVDGNLAATVEDIWMMARQLKPAAIFIDGAYLVKHPTERDRYRRVAENAELIKSELAALAPVVCSWQFARTAAKKQNSKKAEKVGLEDIGYSDAIAQVASIVLGLFEEESVETLKQRKVEILKGRSGEVGQFHTKWDWQSMDFSEIEEEDVTELQFV